MNARDYLDVLERTPIILIVTTLRTIFLSEPLDKIKIFPVLA